MLEITDSLLQPIPLRVSTTDDPAKLLRFTVEAFGMGLVALATLVEIRGGAARALGSHVVVASDGRYCGYVSGGCVEAAVAAEALLAMAEGCDRIVKFGEGSPFFDIALPCGGGISVAIHLLRDPQPLQMVLDRLNARRAVGLSYLPRQQRVRLTDAPGRSGWTGEEFVSVYRPQTLIVISGQMCEAQAIAEVAEASSYDVVRIPAPGRNLSDPWTIDPFTAVILLHHDLDAEAAALDEALKSPAFYIGALGSSRTHKRRVERLIERCFEPQDIRRLKAPIGIFGPARDSASLALSVLADVAATRLAVFG